MIFHAIHRTWVFVKKSCILGRSLPSCSNQTVKCDKSFCLAFLEKHSHRGGRTKCESPHTSRRCPSIGTYGPQLPIDMDTVSYGGGHIVVLSKQGVSNDWFYSDISRRLNRPMVRPPRSFSHQNK